MDGWTRLAPYLAVVDRFASGQKQSKKEGLNFVLTRSGYLQVVLAHPPVSLALFQRAPPGRYSDDWIFNYQGEREWLFNFQPSLYIAENSNVCTEVFIKVFITYVCPAMESQGRKIYISKFPAENLFETQEDSLLSIL